MVRRSDTILQGMGEIRAYVNRSEATVVRWIKELGFPARRITGGTYESDKALVDEWRRKQIDGEKTGPSDAAVQTVAAPSPAAPAAAGRSRGRKGRQHA